MMQKRTALKLVLAGAAAAMLAGCGDKTEHPKRLPHRKRPLPLPPIKLQAPTKWLSSM